MLKHIERRLYGDAVAEAIAILQTAKTHLDGYTGDFNQGLDPICRKLWEALPKHITDQTNYPEYRHILEVAVLLVHRINQRKY